MFHNNGKDAKPNQLLMQESKNPGSHLTAMQNVNYVEEMGEKKAQKQRNHIDSIDNQKKTSPSPPSSDRFIRN